MKSALEGQKGKNINSPGKLGDTNSLILPIINNNPEFYFHVKFLDPNTKWLVLVQNFGPLQNIIYYLEMYQPEYFWQTHFFTLHSPL